MPNRNRINQENPLQFKEGVNNDPQNVPNDPGSASGGKRRRYRKKTRKSKKRQRRTRRR